MALFISLYNRRGMSLICLNKMIWLRNRAIERSSKDCVIDWLTGSSSSSSTWNRRESSGFRANTWRWGCNLRNDHGIPIRHRSISSLGYFDRLMCWTSNFCREILLQTDRSAKEIKHKTAKTILQICLAQEILRPAPKELRKPCLNPTPSLDTVQWSRCETEAKEQ